MYHCVSFRTTYSDGEFKTSTKELHYVQMSTTVYIIAYSKTRMVSRRIEEI